MFNVLCVVFYIIIFFVVHLTTLSVYNRKSNYVFIVDVKLKVTTDKPTEAEREGGGVTPIRSQPVIKGRWVISTTFRPPDKHCAAG
jgi:hypothetical protein